MSGSLSARRIVAREAGGADVLRLEEVAIPAPGFGEARVVQRAIGVNFIDVYFRSGAYPAPAPPFPLGVEAAGVVEAVGAGVTTVSPGDRVAYAGPPLGAYASARLVDADRLLRVPDGIDDRTAAAMMLKGMTAEYLLHRTLPLREGDSILVHAAAGGVGLLLCQWGHALGLRVIGTVGSAEKAQLATQCGCAEVLVDPTDRLAERVRSLTGGRGVRTVFDSIGRDTFLASLDCLAPRGLLALFGQSSGRAEAIDPQLLAQKGSLYLTRPSLFDYTRSREDLVESFRRLALAVEQGSVRVHVGLELPLAEVREAHLALEGRSTTGSIVLRP
ncbi:MAG: quinone oxidoreductase [Deltaproteobacteria bacterium]|nr:quinone oxidoreductase [Deltaproteobacteria bacterium]